MVNTDLLDQRIEDSGLKIGFIIEKLGLSRTGFDKKRRGINKFRVAEVYVICDLLNLSDEERHSIFYAD